MWPRRATRYVVSVRFTGLIREEFNAAAEPFDEIWHMVKPRDGSRGWTLAGIAAGSVRFRHSTKGALAPPFLLLATGAQLRCRQKNPRLVGGETGGLETGISREGKGKISPCGVS